MTGCAVVTLLLLCGVQWGQAQYDTYYCQPGRDVVVHLFEWTWPDVATECETHLTNSGVCGVQISNPAEHAIITNPPYPWWQRYWPVSYELVSRGGDEAAFVDMVQRCNDAGVWIYVDAVIDHMTGAGSGIGSSYDNTYDGDNYSYPAVPYEQSDFNVHFGQNASCPTLSGNIRDYSDPVQVRNCMAGGLRDLRLETTYSRENIIQYMNKLINYGVAGLRMGGAEHSWPSDLTYIWDNLNDLSLIWFPVATRPYFFLDVADNWASEYVPELGSFIEFSYGAELGHVIMKRNGQMMTYLQNFGELWGFWVADEAVAFLSNHENQRDEDMVLTFWDRKPYKMGHVFMLGWPYGHIRIMSSYYWERDVNDGSDDNAWMGPPSDANGNTNPVNCTQEAGWVCEHRWRPIQGMIRFHNVALGKPVQKWWDNGANLISFGRGESNNNTVGYIVINNEGVAYNRSYDTGMPPGVYCDVISCDSARPPCVQDGVNPCRQITVDSAGWAKIYIGAASEEEDPYVAIHI